MASSQSTVIQELKENPSDYALRESRQITTLEVEIMHLAVLDANDPANIAISIGEFSVGE
jgi:hypothetical protein